MLIDPLGIGTRAPNAPGKSKSAGTMPATAVPHEAATDEARLSAAVREVNRAIAPLASSIEFSLDQQSGRTVVKVMDKDTQQLIRQIPSLEMLEISHTLDRMQGVLFTQKA